MGGTPSPYDMVLNIVILSLGFFILIKGADWLISGSSTLARRYRISELSIGLTIVAFGTSLPELVVNMYASVEQKSDIVMGNLIGSNNFNLFVILGIAALILPLKAQSSTVWKEVPLSALAAAGLLLLTPAFTGNMGGITAVFITRVEALLLLSGFAVFIYHVYRSLSEAPDQASDQPISGSIGKSVITILVGLLFLFVGGKLVLDNSVWLARTIGMSEKLIGLTIVAAGTSLPELITTIIAAFQRKPDIALGNVIGSNLFNLLFILPISVMVNPVETNNSFTQDIAILLFGTLVLFAFMFVGKRHILERYQGMILLGMFVLYTYYNYVQ
ncbi:MAG: calcium/sodium antiporter [Flavobacteriales bacterium]